MSRTLLVCASHTPMLHLQERSSHLPLWTAYEERAREVAEFDPELVVAFGGDHYTGTHHRLMPAFSVGVAGETLDDVGGFGGRFDVPTELALDCAQAVRVEGVDVAVSRGLVGDHGFSQILHNLLGGVAKRPTLPILVSCIPHPRPPIARARCLGEAVGHFLSKVDKRILVVASGGLSHDPSLLFPPDVSVVGDPVTREYLVTGGATGSLDRDGWIALQKELHAQANEAMIDGTLEPYVSEAWDREFMEVFSSGEMSRFDSWDDLDVVTRGGAGASEVRTWIAAAATTRALGAEAPSFDYYAPHPELGIGFGIAHAVGEGGAR